jgi:hypothetical protein
LRLFWVNACKWALFTHLPNCAAVRRAPAVTRTRTRHTRDAMQAGADELCDDDNAGREASFSSIVDRVIEKSRETPQVPIARSDPQIARSHAGSPDEIKIPPTRDARTS